MRKSSPSARLDVSLKLVLAAALGAALAACSETFPREQVQAEPRPLPSPIGLDARPSNLACKATDTSAAQAAPKAKIAFELLTPAPFEGFSDIVAQSGRLYVTEQTGYVRYLTGGKTAPLVMDVSAIVNPGYDSGLLSLAFHPKFAQNGFVYLAFTTPHPQQPPPPGVVYLSVLARYRSNDGGLTIDPSSEKRLLVRDQPTLNHQGNKVVFGPDGYLYFAVGDGATRPSPAQDTHALFGKVLRIDVDNGDPYAIPPSNPFASGVAGAPEVYAYGFRNPWRISIDAPTGDVWAGDVGQNAYEEIDKVVRGGNYGWMVREARTCFEATTCDSTGMIDPVVVHDRSEAVAIIGGVVYRGTKIPELTGKYIYADNPSGRFWAIPTDVAQPVPVLLTEGLDPTSPASISLDESGEIVIASTTGRAYRIVPPPTAMPATLSATGCVDVAAPTRLAAGLFPYDVNAPQWLDGATAERALSVPADAQLAVLEGGRLDLPPRSVAMRTLRAEGKLLETQLLLRKPDASWAAYTYAWSSDQKDAVLATAPVSITLPSGRVHVVAPGECASCHQAGARTTLGLEAGQLDRGDVDFGGGRKGNPLLTLEALGMLTSVVPRDSFETLPSPTGYASVPRRARAYVHANCSSCHDGSKPEGFDLRYAAPVSAPRACQLLASMRADGPARMPPVGSRVRDEAAVRLLSDWALGLPDAQCP